MAFRCKTKKCTGCGHPRDDHSIYRNRCLHSDCPCAMLGGYRWVAMPV